MKKLGPLANEYYTILAELAGLALQICNFFGLELQYSYFYETIKVNRNTQPSISILKINLNIFKIYYK